MDKVRVLKYLQDRGLNVHSYQVVHDRYSLGRAIHEYGECSIRFNSFDDSLELPFAYMDENNWDIVDILHVANKAEELGCHLIVSNGRKFDKDMRFNICAKIARNGDFTLEASGLKVPLRKMYDYPIMSIIGNIQHPMHWWNVYGKRYGNLTEIRDILYKLYTNGIFEEYVECTTYIENVGVLNDNIVFWHLWSKGRRDSNWISL